MKKMNKKVIFVMYFFVIAISFFGENEVYSIMSSAFFSLFIGMHLARRPMEETISIYVSRRESPLCVHYN